MFKQRLSIVAVLCAAGALAGSNVGAQVQSRCLAGKNKCVGKRLASVLRCYQKAQTPGKPADPNTNGCLTKALAKFDGGATPAKGCFAKLENHAGNDCLPPLGNTAAAGALADQCVSDVLALLGPTVTTTTTSTTTTTLPTTCGTEVWAGSYAGAYGGMEAISSAGCATAPSGFGIFLRASCSASTSRSWGNAQRSRGCFASTPTGRCRWRMLASFESPS